MCSFLPIEHTFSFKFFKFKLSALILLDQALYAYINIFEFFNFELFGLSKEKYYSAGNQMVFIVYHYSIVNKITTIIKITEVKQTFFFFLIALKKESSTVTWSIFTFK